METLSEHNDLIFFWTESPLHAGGDPSTGFVDLPIQRERTTGHPIIRDSTVKGVLRSHARQQWTSNDDQEGQQILSVVFGPETGASEHAGAVRFSEARLLLFPVRSLRGVFAWITCPLVLNRFARDFSRIDGSNGRPFPRWVFPGPVMGRACVTEHSDVSLEDDGGRYEIVLEEFSLRLYDKDDLYSSTASAARWMRENALPNAAEYEFYKKRLCRYSGNPKNPETLKTHSHLVILSDDDFRYFVENSTDVAQRIRIDAETGTVSGAALWVEESLPSDCLLYSTIHSGMPRSKKVPDGLCEDQEGQKEPSAVKVRAVMQNLLGKAPIVQIGGDETIGRGLTRAYFWKSKVDGG